MAKYICDECENGKHLNCTANRQAIAVVETNEATNEHLPVCICACFGVFISKEKRETYNNRTVNATKAQRKAIDNASRSRNKPKVK